MSPGAPAGESTAAAGGRRRARTRAVLACAANLLALAAVIWLGPAPDVLLACAVVLGGFALLWLREARRAA